jgi:uncharacterized membrane protein
VRRLGRRLALPLVAAAALAAPAPALADSADVVNADVNLRLGPDAALLVTEQLTFDYEGSYHASYRDIPLDPGEEITNVSVSEPGRVYKPGGCTFQGCTDETGRFDITTNPDGDGIWIVWHHNASDEERTFKVAYRVVAPDHVIAYDDAIDVYWQVWGDQWDFGLDHLTATFTDPALEPRPDGGEATPESPSAIWGHPREVEGRDFLEPGVARIEADDILPKQFVEMRVLVPRVEGQNVSAAGRGEGDGLTKVLEEEDAVTEDFNSPFNKAKRWVGHNAILLAGLLGALALGVLGLMLWMSREYPTSTPKHVPEPPDEAGPALAYGLANEGEDSTDTVLATLLDLIERGFYDSKQATTEDEKLDLAISKASKRPNTSKLEPYEASVLSFFDQLIEDETVPMSDMKDRIPEHDAVWRSRWESMTAGLNGAEEGQLEWDRNLNPASLLLALGVLVVAAVIALAYNNVEGKWLVPAAIGLIVAIVIALWPARRLRRLAPEYRERAAKWESFSRWTDDFPRLKDDPPATLDLWKRILIYGVAFGTADRMIKSGRIPEPVLQDSSNSWTHGYFAGSYTSHAFSGSDFSSGFSSQVAPESSSSSGGGGGFSGGGGGGVGGGGGGSW